jgi:hypothetical protein
MFIPLKGSIGTRGPLYFLKLIFFVYIGPIKKGSLYEGGLENSLKGNFE